MKIACATLILVFIACSCSVKKTEIPQTDWSTELIGVGFIGENPDSLHALFSYYPHGHNQPERMNYLYEGQSKISGDTIAFSNTKLIELFRDLKFDQSTLNESSQFLISKEKGFYKFSKINGHKIIPKSFYFKKYPNEYPKHFKYQSLNGYDRWDNYQIEINGKDSIKIRLYGNPYSPYLFEMNRKSLIDDLFISSYLNLACQRRYDTTTISGLFLCGVAMDEVLIYNDSVFKYDTYFWRVPHGGILLNYLHSKIDTNVHCLKEHRMDDTRMVLKSFDQLPVAVESEKVLLVEPSKN